MTHTLFHYSLSFLNFSNQAMMPFYKNILWATLINTYLNTFQTFSSIVAYEHANQNKFLESFLPNPTHHNLLESSFLKGFFVAKKLDIEPLQFFDIFFTSCFCFFFKALLASSIFQKNRLVYICMIFQCIFTINCVNIYD